MLRIIALDPGGTTGWATYTAYEDPGLVRTAAGQLGPGEHHSDLYTFLELQLTDDTTIICESFEFRQGQQRNNINLMSKEYIGVTKLLAQERKVPLVFQTAAKGKGFVTDDKLKACGLWHPGFPHANDANRHLLYYIVVETKLPARTAILAIWRDM